MSADNSERHTIDLLKKIHIDSSIIRAVRILEDEAYKDTFGLTAIQSVLNAIGDPTTEIGKRAREIHGTIGKLLQQ